jgi:hypothetical protein
MASEQLPNLNAIRPARGPLWGTDLTDRLNYAYCRKKYLKERKWVSEWLSVYTDRFVY